MVMMLYKNSFNKVVFTFIIRFSFIIEVKIDEYNK